MGYMVRSDKRVCFLSCRIIYMTIGILLRMLVNRQGTNNESNDNDDHNENHNTVPPLSIDTISHLIIDETHERDVNTDFSLTLLKGMMMSSLNVANSMPRLILMSATASSDLFVSYFTTKNDSIPVTISVPGRTFPVEIKWLSDCEKFCGQQQQQCTSTRMRSARGCTNDINDERRVNSSRSSSNTSNIELSPRATEQIDNKLIRALIIKIIEEQQQSKGMFRNDETTEEQDGGKYRTSGAILVFLPGLGEIESLARCLYEERGTIVSNRDVCKIMKLHSSIPKSEQRKVFQPALQQVKVVLATNIAEVSHTHYQLFLEPSTSNIMHFLPSLIMTDINYYSRYISRY